MRDAGGNWKDWTEALGGVCCFGVRFGEGGFGGQGGLSCPVVCFDREGKWLITITVGWTVLSIGSIALYQ